jgi:hypothetical protein
MVTSPKGLGPKKDYAGEYNNCVIYTEVENNKLETQNNHVSSVQVVLSVCELLRLHSYLLRQHKR